jgi:hypothetical protein
MCSLVCVPDPEQSSLRGRIAPGRGHLSGKTAFRFISLSNGIEPAPAMLNTSFLTMRNYLYIYFLLVFGEGGGQVVRSSYLEEGFLILVR